MNKKEMYFLLQDIEQSMKRIDEDQEEIEQRLKAFVLFGQGRFNENVVALHNSINELQVIITLQNRIIKELIKSKQDNQQ